MSTGEKHREKASVGDEAPDATTHIETGHADAESLSPARATGASDVNDQPDNCTPTLPLAVQQLLQRPDDGRWVQLFKLAELGVVSSSLLHEIRQPLFALKGYLQMILHDQQQSGLVDLRLQKSIKLVEEIEAMAGEFLEFSRAARNQRVPIDLRAPIEGAINLLAGRMRKARVQSMLEVPSDLPVVMGDPATLQQVLVNLLGNAIDALAGREDYSPRIVWVKASRSPERSEVHLHVADNGTGISEGDAARIFDYFFTTKPEGRGTGLGLAISLSIVRAHGGDISLIPAHTLAVDGEQRPVTVFRLSLPSAHPTR